MTKQQALENGVKAAKDQPTGYWAWFSFFLPLPALFVVYLRRPRVPPAVMASHDDPNTQRLFETAYSHRLWENQVESVKSGITIFFLFLFFVGVMFWFASQVPAATEPAPEYRVLIGPKIKELEPLMNELAFQGYRYDSKVEMSSKSAWRKRVIVMKKSDGPRFRYQLLRVKAESGPSAATEFEAVMNTAVQSGFTLRDSVWGGALAGKPLFLVLEAPQ